MRGDMVGIAILFLAVAFMANPERFGTAAGQAVLAYQATMEAGR